jgi:uncharacterized protein YndB with AHSA1/START domain
MTNESRATVQVQRRFDVPPWAVFDALVDPAKVRTWIAAPNLTDESVRIDLKARVGRAFCFIVGRGAAEVTHSGEYLEVDRPERLVFTWVVSSVSKETTLVRIDLKPVASAWGGTDLVLSHERVLPSDLARTEARWSDILEAIATIVQPEGTSPRP